MEQNRMYAQSIDGMCRYCFPIAFIIFNTVYWIYYLCFAED